MTTPLYLEDRKEAILLLRPDDKFAMRHYGPGPHPGTGTEQVVHGTGGGRESRWGSDPAGQTLDALHAEFEKRGLHWPEIVRVPPDEVPQGDLPEKALASYRARDDKLWVPDPAPDEPATGPEGFFAVPGWRGVLLHELGHAAHSRNAPTIYMRDSWLTDAEMDTAEKVSQYAYHGMHEFVAETFAAAFEGRDLPQDVISLYEKLGGATQALVSRHYGPGPHPGTGTEQVVHGGGGGGGEKRVPHPPHPRLTALSPSVAEWTAAKPWQASVEDVKAGKVPGLAYDPGMSAGIAAHAGRAETITVGPPFFEGSDDSRVLLLYHEAGHRVAAYLLATGDGQKVLEPWKEGEGKDRAGRFEGYDNFAGLNPRPEEFLADVYAHMIVGGRSVWEDSTKYTDVYDAVSGAADVLGLPASPLFRYAGESGERHLEMRHYGPGPHPGTGTEQAVHGGGGGRARKLAMDRETGATISVGGPAGRKGGGVWPKKYNPNDTNDFETSSRNFDNSARRIFKRIADRTGFQPHNIYVTDHPYKALDAITPEPLSQAQKEQLVSRVLSQSAMAFSIDDQVARSGRSRASLFINERVALDTYKTTVGSAGWDFMLAHEIGHQMDVMTGLKWEGITDEFVPEYDKQGRVDIGFKKSTAINDYWKYLGPDYGRGEADDEYRADLFASYVLGPMQMKVKLDNASRPVATFRPSEADDAQYYRMIRLDSDPAHAEGFGRVQMKPLTADEERDMLDLIRYVQNETLPRLQTRAAWPAGVRAILDSGPMREGLIYFNADPEPKVSGALRRLHYGPGPHPGTGTEQEVHGGGGGSAKRVDLDWEQTILLAGYKPTDGKNILAAAKNGIERGWFERWNPDDLSNGEAWLSPTGMAIKTNDHEATADLIFSLLEDLDPSAAKTYEKIVEDTKGKSAVDIFEPLLLGFGWVRVSRPAPSVTWGTVPNEWGIQWGGKMTEDQKAAMDRLVSRLDKRYKGKYRLVYDSPVEGIGDDPEEFKETILGFKSVLRHYGPGPHPGTGTGQEVHGGDGRGPSDSEYAAAPNRIDPDRQFGGSARADARAWLLFERAKPLAVSMYDPTDEETPGLGHAELAARYGYASWDARGLYGKSGETWALVVYDEAAEVFFYSGEEADIDFNEVMSKVYRNWDDLLDAVGHTSDRGPLIVYVSDDAGFSAKKLAPEAVAFSVSGPLRRLHYGPGPHPGTGTEQEVHAGDGGQGKKVAGKAAEMMAEALAGLEISAHRLGQMLSASVYISPDGTMYGNLGTLAHRDMDERMMDWMGAATGMKEPIPVGARLERMKGEEGIGRLTFVQTGRKDMEGSKGYLALDIPKSPSRKQVETLTDLMALYREPEYELAFQTYVDGIISTGGTSERELWAVIGVKRHYGPGPHPGTGTEQEVHAGGGGQAKGYPKDSYWRYDGDLVRVLREKENGSLLIEIVGGVNRGGTNTALPKELEEVDQDDDELVMWTEKGAEATQARAIEIFGITDDPEEGGYILDDGSMLNFSGSNEGGTPGTRALDHRDIGRALLDDEPGGTEGMFFFMDQTGAIRMSFQGGDLNVDFTSKPNEAQKRTLQYLGQQVGTIYWDVGRMGDRGYAETLESGEIDEPDEDSIRQMFRDIVTAYLAKSLAVSGPLRRLHYGPGAHPGTGTEQQVHAGGGGRAKREVGGTEHDWDARGDKAIAPLLIEEYGEEIRRVKKGLESLAHNLPRIEEAIKITGSGYKVMFPGVQKFFPPDEPAEGTAEASQLGMNDYWILPDGSLLQVESHELSGDRLLDNLSETDDLHDANSLSGEYFLIALGWVRWSSSGNRGVSLGEMKMTDEQAGRVSQLAGNTGYLKNLPWETYDIKPLGDESVEGYFAGYGEDQGHGVDMLLQYRHYGPGAHPGTGTEQEVHAGGGGRASRGSLSDISERIPRGSSGLDIEGAVAIREYVEADMSERVGRPVRWDIRRFHNPEGEPRTGWQIEDANGNRLLANLGMAEGEILLTYIAAEPKGQGLGTAFMETMRDLANIRGIPFRVTFVTNEPFYERFPWLKRESGDYVYEPLWGVTQAQFEKHPPEGYKIASPRGEDIAWANPDGTVSLTPSFFEHGPRERDDILAHEKAHFLESRIPPEEKARLFDDPRVMDYRGRNINEKLANMIQDNRLPETLWAYLTRHYGPGPHPGTGTEQQVHAGGRGRELRTEEPDPGTRTTPEGIYIAVDAERAKEFGTHSAEWNGKGFVQPSGAPIRGKLIEYDDPRIPDTVYHMTANISGKEASGVIRRQGKAKGTGLGGDENDQMVSLTISEDYARQLANDLATAIEFSRAVEELGPKPEYVSPPRGEEGRRGYQRGGEWMEDSDKEAYASQLADMLNRFDRTRPEGYTFTTETSGQPQFSPNEALRTYFQYRAKFGPQNPLFFGDTENYAKMDPANVGYISIPKPNLKTGALLTDFDLDNPVGLQEIRIYGDLPLAGATYNMAR